MRILSTILRRLVATVPVLLVVALVIFSVLRLTPGDPAAIVAGDGATLQQIAEIRAKMGLDEPIPMQFYHWITDVLRGDFGTSLISGQPVSHMILDRMGPTIATTVYTIIYTILVSIPVGILAAWRRGKAVDKAVAAGSVMGFSVPVFITAYILIFIFSMVLGWLPVQGYKPLSDGVWPHIKHLILPIASLGTIYIALVTRFARTSIIDTLGEDYIRTARAKGLGERSVLTRHALPNAGVPILTIIGVSITMLIGGVVVT
ncbi:MAG TPA: ABC transporter permease, partial [Burkholderiaceae bacterium]|nr:ABC transporter permease [Burkholderiaceae bacterium]